MRIAAAVLSLLLVCAAGHAQPIRIEPGLVDGLVLESGVRAWLGIPMAAPPVRELRWKPPQPVPSWNGVFHADRPAPMCLQTLRTRTMNHYFGNEATSEDCLYLNVWAPPSGEKLPVIVWIYGGGFNVGSASMANYSGENLAASGVVRVNLAYRLGALGFLAHPELTAESGYGGSGNYGLMDLIAGLRWVQRNIAAFGGDPANVTIAGQSAGSMAVALLQASPEARGLFHKVVGMSGSPFGEPANCRRARRGRERGFGAAARARGALDRGPSGHRRRQDRGGRRASCTDRPRRPLRDRRAAGVRVGAAQRRARDARLHARRVVSLAGAGRRAWPSSRRPSAALSRKRPARCWPRTAPAMRRARGAPRPISAATCRSASQMANWARAQAKHSRSPAYAYFFARRQPYAPGITFIDHDPATAGAYHSAEIPYFLKTRESLNLFRRTRIWEDIDVALEEDMTALLLSFARSGEPRSKRVPRWPVFDAAQPRVVSLGEEVQVQEWPNYAALGVLAAPVAAAAPAPHARRPRD